MWIRVYGYMGEGNLGIKKAPVSVITGTKAVICFCGTTRFGANAPAYSIY